MCYLDLIKFRTELRRNKALEEIDNLNADTPAFYNAVGKYEAYDFVLKYIDEISKSKVR